MSVHDWRTEAEAQDAVDFDSDDAFDRWLDAEDARGREALGLVLAHHRDGVREFRSRAGRQHGLVVADASDPGRWRISYYDADGFSGHDTFDTEHDALVALSAQGLNTPATGSLDRLAATEAWARGTRATKIMMTVNAMPHNVGTAILGHFHRKGRTQDACDAIHHPGALSAGRRGIIHPSIASC